MWVGLASSSRNFFSGKAAEARVVSALPSCFYLKSYRCFRETLAWFGSFICGIVGLSISEMAYLFWVVLGDRKFSFNF